MSAPRALKTRIAAVCLVGFGAAGCWGEASLATQGEPAETSGNGASCEVPSEPQSLKLGIIPGSQSLVTFVMEEQGFAEDHNLELELERFQNPSALHVAIGQKTVEVGFGGLTALAVARS